MTSSKTDTPRSKTVETPIHEMNVESGLGFRLEALMAEFLARGKTPLDSVPAEMTSELRAQLDTLGYLE